MFFPHLVLGTAQLGLPYGIANKAGQPDQAVATTIIREAWNQGIREFDTTQGYGDSEKVLGKALAELGFSKEARIISKFDPNLDHLNASDMSKALDESLERLGVRSLYGIMLHREEMLSLWNKGLAKILHAFILSGRVEKIGISVYSPDKSITIFDYHRLLSKTGWKVTHLSAPACRVRDADRCGTHRQVE